MLKSTNIYIERMSAVNPTRDTHGRIIPEIPTVR